MKEQATSHGSVEPQQKTPTLFGVLTILVVGLLMLLLFWFGTKSLYWFAPENPNPNPDAVRATERRDILEKINADAAADLDRLAWKEESAGTVQIPVHRAMELIVAKLDQSNPIRATTLVDPIRAAEEAAAKAAPTSSPAAPTDAATASPSEAQAADAPRSEEAAAEESAPPEAGESQPHPAAESSEPAVQSTEPSAQ